ncbi:alpha/beta fold hydrolase [Streptomyces sp. NPDC016469]|uniref:alpha/beta fold hydrolase n=1 Tax=Streptomyces sp. NPDC016469 TaxID=3157191 RepID=UPI0033DEE121
MSTSPVSHPSDVTRAYLDAFGRGDTEAALALLREDVVWHVDGAPEVPTIGLRQGKARIREWMDGFPPAFEPRGFRVFSVADDGDSALVTGWFRYLVRATQSTVEGDFTMRFTVRDGLISHYQIFEDSLALARAFRAEQATAASDARLRVNDTVYAYDDIGEGPVVLFLHGLFLDRTVFAAQAGALAEGCRCISVDLPGHGGSTWPSQGWTLDDIADDIALMVQEKGWGPVTVVGQSQGGMVAMRLAARRPDLVARMALVGTSARAEPADRIDTWQQRRTLLGTALDTAGVALAEEIQNMATHPDWRATHPEEARAERRLVAAQNPGAMQLALDAAVLHRPDGRHLLTGIQAPTLVMAGENDLAMPVELSAELAEHIPDARLEILDGVAHHAPLEAPEQVSRLLSRFVRNGL